MRIYRAHDHRRVSRPYGDLTVLANRRELGAAVRNIDLKILRIRPHERTSTHRHLLAASAFYVIRGTLNVRDEQSVIGSVSDGDVVAVPPGATHCLENISEETAAVIETENPPYAPWDVFPRKEEPYAGPEARRRGRFWPSGAGSLRVKICGIRSLDAALACLEAGVHAIGLNMTANSKGLSQLSEWTSWLPAIPKELSVFVLTDTCSVEELELIGTLCGADTIQLQGVIDADTVCRLARACKDRGWRVVRALGIDENSSSWAKRYVEDIGDSIDAWLLDSAWWGGTGVVADRRGVEDFLETTRLPVILAGGLHSENVETAVPRDGVFGIDVESGVEKRLFGGTGGERGWAVKSAERIHRLMEAVGRI